MLAVAFLSRKSITFTDSTQSAGIGNIRCLQTVSGNAIKISSNVGIYKIGSNRVKLKFVTLTILVAIMACENVGHCENKNPIFDKFSLDSNEYISELTKRLKSIGVQNAHYYITGSGYNKESDVKFVSLRIEGIDLCAYANVNIYKMDSVISPIFETESFGYRGAELEGLKIEFSKGSGKPELIYGGAEDIID